MAEYVFLNDKLVDAGKACVSVSDGGFLYGAGLFETMRSYNGVVFTLDEHLERLLASAKALSIEVSYDKEYLADAVYKLLKANKLTDARIRMTVTGGSMSEAEKGKSTLLITAVELQSYPDEYYQKGVQVVLCPFKQNVTDPTCGHKTLNYYSRILGLNLAHQKRAAEVLWFTPDNRLAEGCISNVFLVKDSTLYTPTLDTPVLPGVTRKIICEIAAENSVKLTEKDLYIDDCLEADEIFMTNSVMQVMPVCKLEAHDIGDYKVGPITKKLIGCFDQYVKDNCRVNK
ncbi:aminotransferase class IV [Planctomycetota bacterium]